MITRLVLYSALVIFCSALGYTLEDTVFWCAIGLFWAVERWGQHQGFKIGVAHAMTIYLEMTPEQREELFKEIKGVDK